MLRNGPRSKSSRSKRQSGFFTSKSENSSVSFFQLQSFDLYSNQSTYNKSRHTTGRDLSLHIPSIHESLQTVPEIDTTNNNNAGNYYATVRSPSEQSISSNLSFLSKNSSVLDLIYQDLEESASTEDEGETTNKSDETFLPVDTKALFVVKNDPREKGQWKLLSEESDLIIDYEPEFLHDVQYGRIERTDLDFS